MHNLFLFLLIVSKTTAIPKQLYLKRFLFPSDAYLARCFLKVHVSPVFQTVPKSFSFFTVLILWLADSESKLNSWFCLRYWLLYTHWLVKCFYLKNCCQMYLFNLFFGKKKFRSLIKTLGFCEWNTTIMCVVESVISIYYLHESDNFFFMQRSWILQKSSC